LPNVQVEGHFEDAASIDEEPREPALTD
jgi:hypothetical protein